MEATYSRIRQVGDMHVYAMSCSKFETPPHVHTQPRLSFILQGHTVEIDDRRRRRKVGPMTVVYQPPGWKHAHVVETDLSTICVDLSPSFLDRVSDVAIDLERPIVLESPPIAKAALRVLKEMWADDSASPLILEALMIEWVGECVRQRLPKLASTPPRWLRQAREFLQDRYIDHPSLDEIGLEVGVHPSHLSRMFRAYYGETVGEFTRRLRLEDAIRQVAATGLPIGEIAANAGFADNAHFSRECRRALGVSPQELRRSL